MMKSDELRLKNNEDLQKVLLDSRKVQFGLRMQIASQQLNDTSQVRKVRREIARIKTIQCEKVSAK